MAVPSTALAQRGRAGGRSPVVVVAPQRSPTIVYPPFYGPWGWQYPYGYGYPYPPYGYQRPYWLDDAASLRIQATPREAEVFVDGARAGIVDDFDGVFQRLHLKPGSHEIALYLPGFRTWRETRYFGPRASQKILHTMLQLAPGQPDEPRPTPPPAPAASSMNGRDDRPLPPSQRGGYNPPPPSQRQQPQLPQPQPPQAAQPIEVLPGQPAQPIEPAPEPPQPSAPRAYGTMSLGFQPGDAEVLIDGQAQKTASGQRFVIQLTEGVHHIVVRKNGYTSFETDLQIRRGRTLSFDVTLER